MANQDPLHVAAELINERVGVTNDEYLSLAACKSQSITITASSQQSAAIVSGNVLVSADTLCYATAGPNPTATATLPADVFIVRPNTVYPFYINPGDKIAVIGTSGTFYITETS